MKTVVIFAALCVAYAAAQHRRCPLIREIGEGYKKCVETTNPDEGTRRLIREREGLDDEKANCLRACVLKEAGLMENAAFNFPRVTELLNDCGPKNPEAKDEIVAKLKSCQADAEASGNECTVAGKYADCAHKMMPPRRRGQRGDEPE